MSVHPVGSHSGRLDKAGAVDDLSSYARRPIGHGERRSRRTTLAGDGKRRQETTAAYTAT